MTAVTLCAAGVCAAALLSCGGTVLTEPPGGGGGASATGGAAGESTTTGPTVCKAGHADCNGDGADGCEAAIETDPEHCGSCERDCLGSACSGGACEPQVLASNLYFPNRLTLDGARVYWTSSDGRINAIPPGGGAISVLAGGGAQPWDIAVDGAGVYWADDDDNTVISLPFAGLLPVLLTEAGNPVGIAVHDGVVYYTDTYDKGSELEHVVRFPLPAGPAQIVSSTPGAWMVAVDDQRAYWTDPASDAVWSAPLSGGDAAMMAAVLEPHDIEVDSDAVYVTGLEGTFRIPLGGGAPSMVVSGAGLGLAIDATHLFVGAADGRLLRVPKAGGPATVLSRAELYPYDIAVNDQHVFWLVRSITGALMRTPK